MITRPTPTVSIIIVTRNDLTRLRGTLTNALHETQELNIELVVIDGCSTDGTVEFLRSLSSDQLVFTSEVDHGIYDAMNKGARRARGTFLYFLNSGDQLSGQEPWRTVVTKLQETSAAWGLGQVEHHGQVPATLVPREHSFSAGRFWLGRQEYNHQGLVYNKQAFQALGGYDLTFGFAADLHLSLKFSIISTPLLLMEVCASYEGGGISEPLVAQTPRILHRARYELLGVRGMMLAVSRIYAVLQTFHRRGYRATFTVWRIRRRSFSNPGPLRTTSRQL